MIIRITWNAHGQTGIIITCWRGVSLGNLSCVFLCVKYSRLLICNDFDSGHTAVSRRMLTIPPKLQYSEIVRRPDIVSTYAKLMRDDETNRICHGFLWPSVMEEKFRTLSCFMKQNWHRIMAQLTTICDADTIRIVL